MTQDRIAWCGIDVSNKTFDVGLVVDQQVEEIEKVPARQFKRTKQGVSSFMNWLADNLRSHRINPTNVGIVMEATGRMSMELYTLLHMEERQFHCVAIVNPRVIKAFLQSLGLRNKTDRLDGKGMGFYRRERNPTHHKPMEPAYQKVRELTRYRRSLVNDRTALSLRLSSSVDSWAIKDLNERIKSLKKSVERCEAELKATVSGNKQLKREFKILTSMVGVGPVTAWTVLGELGDLKRFKKSRQLSAMVGLSPQVQESGTSIWKQSRLSKQGGQRVREVLYMAAMVATNRDCSFRDNYERLIGRGKKGKVALCAVMRKMMLTMRSMIITGTHYDPHFKSVQKQSIPCGKGVNM